MDWGGSPSLLSLVRERARSDPDDVALVAPGRPDATYGDLAEVVERVAGALRARGIVGGERVALVVENGPEAATAFLGIGSAAVCAPLNPSYRSAEFEFYLRDLNARAVVVDARLETSARDVAAALGIEVVELRVDPKARAGSFALDDDGVLATVSDPSPAAEALVLHTSGTTAQPKIVPLRHGQLLASARSVSATLGLGPADRCLNVMPLFHIHGLVASLLASLWAGGSVVCTPGFHQVRFFDWLRATRPTWTTAVPTMHQSILERALRDSTLVTGHGLRFVRSSSAALPVSVLEGLERVLQVPVVEAYGMTEAAHQMTSNPLPPGVRKGGSVGLPAGPHVAILDGDGRALEIGEVGEVAVRGETVFSGYESPADANAEAFSAGWFRTGDQGRLDEGGYLFLLGRLKEIINRGGEKISPAEIDDVLLRHPAVAQAVTFGMPDDRLGEEVAAAVVLRHDTVGERELQDFVSLTVAPFKVPRRVVVVDDIPKGATGKVQRTQLADRLGLTTEGVRVAGATWASKYLEDRLRDIWADVLAVSDVGPHDDFFALGGDSILGAEAVARVRDLVGKPDLPLVSIVRAPTPHALAAEIEDHYGWNRSGVVRITKGDDSAMPLFFVHGVDGDIIRFAGIARLLGPGRSVFALRAPGHEASESPPTDVEGLASAYLDEIRNARSEGPYLIAASCMGGTVALELAHRLATSGDACGLVLVDPRLRRPTMLRYRLYRARRKARPRRVAHGLRRRLGEVLGYRHPQEPGEVQRALEIARDSYAPRATSSPVALLRSSDFEAKFDLPFWYLRSVFPRIVLEDRLRGDHDHLFVAPAVVELHEAMTRALARLEEEFES